MFRFRWEPSCMTATLLLHPALSVTLFEGLTLFHIKTVLRTTASILRLFPCPKCICVSSLHCANDMSYRAYTCTRQRRRRMMKNCRHAMLAQWVAVQLRRPTLVYSAQVSDNLCRGARRRSACVVSVNRSLDNAAEICDGRSLSIECRRSSIVDDRRDRTATRP